ARLPHAREQVVRDAVRAAMRLLATRARTLRPGFLPLLLALTTACAARDADTAPEPAVGPRTMEVDVGAYAAVFYVSAGTGSDETGDGSASRPWRTIGRALAQVTDAGPGRRYAVFVAEGVYTGSTLVMKEHVDLYGGFEPAGWRRDI